MLAQQQLSICRFFALTCPTTLTFAGERPIRTKIRDRTDTIHNTCWQCRWRTATAVAVAATAAVFAGGRLIRTIEYQLVRPIARRYIRSRRVMDFYPLAIAVCASRLASEPHMISLITRPAFGDTKSSVPPLPKKDFQIRQRLPESRYTTSLRAIAHSIFGVLLSASLTRRKIDAGHHPVLSQQSGSHPRGSHASVVSLTT